MGYWGVREGGVVRPSCATLLLSWRPRGSYRTQKQRSGENCMETGAGDVPKCAHQREAGSCCVVFTHTDEACAEAGRRTHTEVTRSCHAGRVRWRRVTCLFNMRRRARTRSYPDLLTSLAKLKVRYAATAGGALRLCSGQASPAPTNSAWSCSPRWIWLEKTVPQGLKP